MTYIQETDNGNPFFNGHSYKTMQSSTLEGSDFGKLINIDTQMNPVELLIDASNPNLEQFHGKTFHVRLLNKTEGNEAFITRNGFADNDPISINTENDVLTIYWDVTNSSMPELYII